jgi:hypothetical protein
VQRTELAGSAIAVVLGVALVVGVALSLWTLTSVLALFPYFIILAIAGMLGWGFHSRIKGWFPKHQYSQSSAQVPSAAETPMKGVDSSPRTDPKQHVRAPSKRRWHVDSLQLGPVGVSFPKPESKQVVELLCSDRVKIAPGVHKELPFLLDAGDKVEGTATDYYGRNFDWYFLDDHGYAAFYSDRTPDALARGSNSPAAHVDATVPHSGTWHLVLDGQGKKSSRTIEVRLTRIRAG